MTTTCLSCRHLRQRTAQHCSVTVVYYCSKGNMPITNTLSSVITFKKSKCFEGRATAQETEKTMEVFLL